MPRLILNPGTDSAQVYHLEPGIHEIGRRPDNAICIPDGSVSGLHCRLEISGDRYRLADLNSTNGTFVDGRAVTECQLQHGQRLRFGSVDLLFEQDGGEPALATLLPNCAQPQAASASHPPRVRLRTQAESQPVAVDQTAVLHKGPPPLAQPPVSAESSHCKYHPKSPARWLCPKCGKSFCDLCVATRATPHGTAHTCRNCAVDCTPLKVQQKRPSKPRFSRVMWGAFAYPFGKDGLLSLIVGSLLFAVMSVASHFSWWITVLFYGYFFSYLQNVIQATALGESQVEWPTPTDFIQEILVPAFQVLVCVLFSFGPAIGLFVWAATSGNPAIAIAGMLAIGYGCFYFPMAFLAVAMFDSVSAVNPALVIPSIGRVFGKYIVACVVLGVVFAVSKGVAFGLALLMPVPFLPDAIASVFSLYFLLVECRILGLLYWTNSHKLGWFERRPAR